MRRFVRWYFSLSRTIRISLQSLVTALIAYTSALLSVQIASILSIGSTLVFVFHAIVVIVLIAIIVFFSLFIGGYAEITEVEEIRKERALAYAHTLMDNWTSQCMQLLSALSQKDTSKQIYVLHDPLYSIRLLVRSLYETLEAHFSHAERISERIEFEVTFMTRSYLDGKITVAAWANRDGRMPTSLPIRKVNPDVYETTVTARLYQAQRPIPQVVEDTLDAQYDYQELYDHQRDRIRSSIVYPVLSDQNQLIGTLVMHCDKPRFFLRSDLKYWRELLEIIAKRIALEKLSLDHAICGAGEKRDKNTLDEQILHPF